jgi:hypothetical protein
LALKQPFRAVSERNRFPPKPETALKGCFAGVGTLGYRRCFNGAVKARMSLVQVGKTLDLAKEVQQTIDAETSVQPKNMEAVVSLQATKMWDQKQKSLF